MKSPTTDGPPRAVLIAALVLAVGAVVAVLVVAAVMQRPPAQRPVAVSAVPAPRADSPECHRLLEALPAQLGDYSRAPLVEPAPAGAAAWQSGAGGEAIVLRCGLDRPVEFTVGAPIQMVDAVQWFRVGEARAGEAGVGEDRAGDAGAGAGEDARSTWFAVDRAVYVALTLPSGSGPTPIQTLSEIIAKALPAVPVQPGPVS
ncbi:Protein of unknown function (DUF3515) [Mycolicibacterium chubuense NBB4]|uniref:DUF3515 domain-containing protein n=1 Tax=Mycolicibacterium chubuense (strain NBB4) TaxID=710421 RepID=I4BH92_MYCCN|nr:DUF3515 domain-containing protein [Mycolicibacterium chubuense]AFM16649.1 Protein of unknown function (DUF3515) [Mycolicibacterium chubuense NBB4]